MSSIVAGLVLGLASLVFLAPAAVAGQPPPPECATLPANIHVDPNLAPAFAQLMAKSPTFRRQCATVAAARHARVTFTAVAGPRLSSAARARATITRFAYGLLRAVVEIPLPSDYHELIPHELEHVIEQIEGLNLAALAASDGRRAMLVGGGLFETARAQRVGRAVAAEMLADDDRTVAGTARTAARAWRTLSSRAVRTNQHRAGGR